MTSALHLDCATVLAGVLRFVTRIELPRAAQACWNCGDELVREIRSKLFPSLGH